MKRPGDHPRVVQREDRVDALVGESAAVLVEQDQRRETGGADRVALGHGLGRVADRVERIGDRAHRLVEIGHLGDAAGVVCDGAVRVERDDQTGHRQLRHDGDSDAVELLAGGVVRADDADRDRDHGRCRRLHAHREAGDDVRGVPGLGRRRDRLDRAPARARVVLGDRDQQERDAQADQRRPVQLPEAELAAVEGERDRDEPDRREDRRHDHGLVEGVDDRVRATADAREERADHRSEDRDPAERQRVQPQLAARERRAEQHDRDRGDGVRLEQVGRHAGAVADVVADVVGDHGRVARVVLGDPRLDLPDQVGADVGGLREDAAAETREHRDQRAAECEADEVVDRGSRACG